MAKDKRDVTARVIDIPRFQSLLGYLEDSADWIGDAKASGPVFREMMADARILSLIEGRQGDVRQLPSTQGSTGDGLVDEACRKRLGFDLLYRLQLILLNAIPYGIAACEILWKKADGLYVPYDFVPIPYTAIDFPLHGGGYGVPYIAGSGIRLDDRFHFLIHKNDRGDSNPRGTPALLGAYWPWKFKKLGFRFWIMAAERIGVPSILALFESRSEKETESRARALSQMINGLDSGSSAAFGNVKDVKVIEAAIQDFNLIVTACNTEIAYAITGQSLATNEAEYGTRAQATVHSATYNRIIIDDSYKLECTIQRLFDVFCEVNFPGRPAPKYDIDSGDYANWETVREAMDRGVPVSINALYEKYRIPKPQKGSDAFIPQAGQGFSFSDGFFLPSRFHRES